MSKAMTEKDFAAKIEWEGGIPDALEYGLKSEDCEPGELRNAWKDLEDRWKTLQKPMSVVERILAAINSEDEDEEESV